MDLDHWQQQDHHRHHPEPYHHQRQRQRQHQQQQHCRAVFLLFLLHILFTKFILSRLLEERNTHTFSIVPLSLSSHLNSSHHITSHHITSH